MEAVTEVLFSISANINRYLSDYVLVLLLVGTGVFFTLKTRFVQIRCFGDGLRRIIKSPDNKENNGNGLTSFQSLMTSVAAQVGTGNIIGACGAILIGGPGAIFWMWVIAFFGMATIYAESVLAIKTRSVKADGTFLGGPVYYIQEAFSGKFGKVLSVFFSSAVVISLGFMGAMVQSNAISEAVGSVSGLAHWKTGLILALLCSFIFIGGVKRIASVAEKVVPVMALLYIMIGIITLFINFKHIPETLGMIFKYAFIPNAIIGGGIGTALKTTVSQGVKRGLFSNEAGMGSTPHAHALANVKRPHDQGVVAMFGVFIDTFIVLSVTALVVISTLYTEGGILHGLCGDSYISATSGSSAIVTKADLMQTAIGEVFGNRDMGNFTVAICLTFFAFTSIIGWNFFGKINFEYLFGKKATVCYSVIAIVFVFLGSCFPTDLVWELSDTFNNIIVIPNVLALLRLSKTVEKESQ